MSPIAAKPVTLQLAQVVPRTAAEGPGWRFAVWFQGCPLRCPGCCNPEMLPLVGGSFVSLDELLQQLDDARELGVEGITLLGGEPFAHAASAAALARAAGARGLSVMVFSGYTLEQLRAAPDPAVAELLAQTDLLVDGPYLQEFPDTRRRWIGSTNQRIHFLTARYAAEDPCWSEPNTLELRLEHGELTVNGFPAAAARDFWRRPAAGQTEVSDRREPSGPAASASAPHDQPRKQQEQQQQ